MNDKTSKKRKILKVFFIGLGLALLFLIAVYFSPISKSGEIHMTQHHPFQSAEAKEQCLALFEEFEKTNWPVESESRYIETSYGNTFIRISGPENASPLVLLHGKSGNSLSWSGNIEKYSKNFRTYAIDTIDDYGLSIYTASLKSGYDYAKWLDQVFTGLGLKNNINLLGISYGGWLASQYAVNYQNRLRKIVLAAPASTVLPLRTQYYIRSVLILLPFRYFKDSFFSWLDPTLKNSDFKEGIDLIETSIKCYKPKYSMVRPTVLNDEELKSIKCSALFLFGEYEMIYSPNKAIDRLERIAPHIKKEIIPDVGHATILRPQSVNEKIIKFLEANEI
jgi:pimeloyl-ACP methyl ester carboxylesterase